MVANMGLKGVPGLNIAAASARSGPRRDSAPPNRPPPLGSQVTCSMVTTLLPAVAYPRIMACCDLDITFWRGPGHCVSQHKRDAMLLLLGPLVAVLGCQPYLCQKSALTSPVNATSVLVTVLCDARQ